MASFGEKLRQQRELRGISLREISEATKISVRFLQALETDRVEVLPGGIFRRSFVREYSRFVGLDPERMVSEFLHAHSDDSSADKTEKKSAAADAPGADRRGFYRRLLLGLTLVGVAGAGWSYSRPLAPTAAVADAAPAVRALVIPGDGLLAPPEPAVTGPEPAAATGPLVLTLKARADCWVALRAGGRLLLDRTLREGESHVLEVGEEVVLDVGDAGALELLINGQPASSLGDRGQVRKNIVINKSNLPSLVEAPSTRRAAHSG